MIRPEIFNEIFLSNKTLQEKALQIYAYQFEHNQVYKDWCSLVFQQHYPQQLIDIPFLPVSFFKTHNVQSSFSDSNTIFESSGTTGIHTSRHFVPDLFLYEQSFAKGFERFYGSTTNWCLLCLLPSYLERKNSSLVYMAEVLMHLSAHQSNGFFLDDFALLNDRILQQELKGQPTLILGVSFALLDFSELYPQKLSHTIVMETGGMKGRKKELIRAELHDILCTNFGVKHIHSEYGMTELLSQAYSTGHGLYRCPPWMQVLVRNEDDPKQISLVGKGLINIIDLANFDSCSFIATDDAGIVYADGSFEILGRSDNSDIRGCSLLTV